MSSISTHAPSGICATPNAERACLPASPNTSAISSDAPFVTMNVLATVIACYGLLENSPSVVIGAMTTHADVAASNRSAARRSAIGE